MSARELKKKPLVEAIIEIRWKLQQKQLGVAIDPHHHLLLGRLYDRLQSQYPEHEQLETSNIPEEMSGYVVQHRFRTAHNDWPLVQLGPGILTVNDTHKYKWEDFRARVVEVKGKLYDAYPKPANLQVENLTLRYIDAVEFDYQSSSVLDFLRQSLKVSVDLPSNLFENTDVEPLPQQFLSQQMYRSKKPLGIIQVRFATGARLNKPALVWETTVQTAGDDMPSMPQGFEDWLDQAHVLANDWFFKMIEGDLHRRFSSE